MMCFPVAGSWAVGICYVIKSEQPCYPKNKKYIFVNEPVNCRT